jgi:sulfite reductase alpha subunit
MQEFLRVIELDPDPRMVDEPRSNPYIFWKEEDVPGGFKRDIKDYRSRHKR